MNVNWKVDKHNSTHNALVFDAGNPIGPSIEVCILAEDRDSREKTICFKPIGINQEAFIHS